jgi:hypothetical protein
MVSHAKVVNMLRLCEVTGLSLMVPQHGAAAPRAMLLSAADSSPTLQDNHFEVIKRLILLYEPVSTSGDPRGL